MRGVVVGSLALGWSAPSSFPILIPNPIPIINTSRTILRQSSSSSISEMGSTPKDTSIVETRKQGPKETEKIQQRQQQQQQKEEGGKKPLEPPEKPLPGDCCGSGCVRCVWDVYYEELEAYSNSLKE